MSRDGWPSVVRALAGVAVGGLAAGCLDVWIDHMAGGLPLLYPGSGIAVGILLCVQRNCSLTFLAAMLPITAVGLIHRQDADHALLLAAGEVAELAAGWWLVDRLAGRPADRIGMKQLLGFVLGAVTAPAVGATIVTLLQGMMSSQARSDLWFRWWSAGSVGMLLFAPAIVALASEPVRHLWPASRHSALKAGELAVVCGAIAGLLWAILHFQRYGLPSLFVPLLIWLALGFGVAATTTAGAAICTVMVLAVGSGAWPFPFGIEFVPPSSNGPLQFLMVLMVLPPVTVAVAVAERERARRALAATERRYALALNAGGMGTWDWDVAADRLTWDDGECRLFGLEPACGPTSGPAFMALVHPDDRATLEEAGRSAAGAGGTFDYEFRIVRPDGSVRWIAERCAATRDATGRLIRLTGVSQDATERKMAEARLERQAMQMRAFAEVAEAAGKAKADFLATMSHEIRTPMTGVLGMADLLAAEELGGRQRGYVEAIRTSGRHLLSIVDDILDFSRIEAGRLKLERIDFSVPSVLERVSSLMAPLAVERGLTLEFEVAAHSPPAVRGDPTRLRQVLLNLVGNALKFTHEGGVAVAARHQLVDRQTIHFRFEVRDTGIGIPEARRAGLFEAFAQADSSTTRRYGGSGLGLAICRRLVEAMGGRIGIEAAPGPGSLFWFEVPFGLGDAVVAAERAALAPVTVPPLRVLVAEDVPVNRDLLREMLNRHGHEAVLAEDGREAVELASRQRFDLVLMDVHMPVMDGVEATRRIRALPPPAGRVPVVALTANVMEVERRRCIAAGMERVVIKPVAWLELFEAMAAAAGRDAVGPAPATPPPGSRAGAPLLDRARIAAVGKVVEPAVLAGFLGRAMAEAERTHAELAAPAGGPEEVRRTAHRLRGTAGNLGLARISELAGAIEDAAGAGLDVAGLVGRLGEAVAATREAVGRKGEA